MTLFLPWALSAWGLSLSAGHRELTCQEPGPALIQWWEGVGRWALNHSQGVHFWTGLPRPLGQNWVVFLLWQSIDWHLLLFLLSKLPKWLILGLPPKVLLWFCLREPRKAVNSARDSFIFSLSPSCLCLTHSHPYSLNSHSDSPICIWKPLIT